MRSRGPLTKGADGSSGSGPMSVAALRAPGMPDVRMEVLSQGAGIRGITTLAPGPQYLGPYQQDGSGSAQWPGGPSLEASSLQFLTG